MSLNVSKLLGDIVAAASAEAGTRWTEIKRVATHEFRTLARDVVFYTRLFTTGEIDREELKITMSGVKAALLSALATLTALAQAAIRRIVNAALGVVRAAANSFVGFALV